MRGHSGGGGGDDDFDDVDKASTQPLQDWTGQKFDHVCRRACIAHGISLRPVTAKDHPAECQSLATDCPGPAAGFS